jgi:hypothetical protein
MSSAKPKPRVKQSDLTAAGKRMVKHLVDYYRRHKVQTKNWSAVDVAYAVLLGKQDDKSLWKR